MSASDGLNVARVDIEAILGALRSHGGRVTTARRAILAALAVAEGHLDAALIARRRGDHNRLGFALQLQMVGGRHERPLPRMWGEGSVQTVGWRDGKGGWVRQSILGRSLPEWTS